LCPIIKNDPSHRNPIEFSGILPIIEKRALSRELAFAMHHAIHHNALIAAMVDKREIDLPQFFGYAPFTIEALSKERK